MNRVKATLIKRKTDDGMVEFMSHVPLGKVYYVDLDTRTTTEWFNAEFNKHHIKEIIVECESGSWLPTECLQIEELFD